MRNKQIIGFKQFRVFPIKYLSRMHKFPRAAVTIRWLKATEIYSFIVPESRGLKSRGGQGCILLEALKENLLYASNLVYGSYLQSLAILGFLRLVDTSLQFLPLSPNSVFFCVCFLFSCKWHLSFDLEPVLIQDDLISRSLITSAKLPFSK